MTPDDLANEFWKMASDERIAPGHRLNAIRELLRAMRAGSISRQRYAAQVPDALMQIMEAEKATPTQRLRAMTMLQEGARRGFYSLPET